MRISPRCARAWVGGLLATWLLAGCAQDVPPPATPAGHHIAYRLFLNDPPAPSDSLGIVADEISEGLRRLFGRIGNETVIHAAWSDWPSADLQTSLLEALGRFDDAKALMVIDPTRFASDSAQLQQPWMSEDASTTLKILNKDFPERDTSALHHNHVRGSFVLFRNLRPDALDDGAYGIFFMANPTANGQPAPVSEALWLAGDSSLYIRFVDFWTRIVDGKSPLLAAESHTYSNLHDHLVWSFPDLQADEAGTEILDHLDTGLTQTRQPAKMRLVLDQLDACHIPFLEKLNLLQAQHEIDLRIVLKPPFYGPGLVQWSLDNFPKGQIRYFWSEDEGKLPAFDANFMTLDGPYPLMAGALSEPRRLSFLFGIRWQLASLKQDWGLWLRILDRSATTQLEAHFDRIWALSSDTIPRPIVREDDGLISCKY